MHLRGRVVGKTVEYLRECTLRQAGMAGVIDVLYCEGLIDLLGLVELNGGPEVLQLHEFEVGKVAALVRGKLLYRWLGVV